MARRLSDGFSPEQLLAAAATDANNHVYLTQIGDRVVLVLPSSVVRSANPGNELIAMLLALGNALKNKTN